MPGLLALLLTLSFPIIGKTGPDVFQSLEKSLVLVPGGPFVMGSREGEADARPAEATVAPFRMGRFEVTVGEYAQYLNDAGVTSAPPPQVRGGPGRCAPRWGLARNPASFVTYDDAERYCAWLSARTGRKVRLPTEAEWECAARGGIAQARYPWGWGEATGRARFDAKEPAPVGSFEANPFGLYDMAGNVFEWCARPAGSDKAPARGGSWAERDPKMLRVFQREFFRPDYRDADVGFRILVEEGASN